jgi:hypothetical protein
VQQVTLAASSTLIRRARRQLGRSSRRLRPEPPAGTAWRRFSNLRLSLGRFWMLVSRAHWAHPPTVVLSTLVGDVLLVS